MGSRQGVSFFMVMPELEEVDLCLRADSKMKSLHIVSLRKGDTVFSCKYEEIVEANVSEGDATRGVVLVLKNGTQKELRARRPIERDFVLSFLQSIVEGNESKMGCSSTIIQGAVERKGRFTWNFRWCLLRKGYLLMFKSENDAVPLEIICLWGTDLSLSGQNSVIIGSTELKFKTKEACSMWYKALSEESRKGGNDQDQVMEEESTDAVEEENAEASQPVERAEIRSPPRRPFLAPVPEVNKEQDTDRVISVKSPPRRPFRPPIPGAAPETVAEVEPHPPERDIKSPPRRPIRPPGTSDTVEESEPVAEEEVPVEKEAEPEDEPMDFRSRLQKQLQRGGMVAMPGMGMPMPGMGGAPPMLKRTAPTAAPIEEEKELPEQAVENEEPPAKIPPPLPRGRSRPPGAKKEVRVAPPPVPERTNVVEEEEDSEDAAARAVQKAWRKSQKLKAVNPARPKRPAPPKPTRAAPVEKPPKPKHRAVEQLREEGVNEAARKVQRAWRNSVQLKAEALPKRPLPKRPPAKPSAVAPGRPTAPPPLPAKPSIDRIPSKKPPPPKPESKPKQEEPIIEKEKEIQPQPPKEPKEPISSEHIANTREQTPIRVRAGGSRGLFAESRLKIRNWLPTRPKSNALLNKHLVDLESEDSRDSAAAAVFNGGGAQAVFFTPGDSSNAKESISGTTLPTEAVSNMGPPKSPPPPEEEEIPPPPTSPEHKADDVSGVKDEFKVATEENSHSDELAELKSQFLIIQKKLSAEKKERIRLEKALEDETNTNNDLKNLQLSGGAEKAEYNIKLQQVETDYKSQLLSLEQDLKTRLLKKDSEIRDLKETLKTAMKARSDAEKEKNEFEIMYLAVKKDLDTIKDSQIISQPTKEVEGEAEMENINNALDELSAIIKEEQETEPVAEPESAAPVEEDQLESDEEKRQRLLDRLVKGQVFLVHRLKVDGEEGETEVVERVLLMSKNAKSIGWMKRGAKMPEKGCTLNVSTIKSLSEGYETPILKLTGKSGREDACFSVLYGKGKILELEAPNEEVKSGWLDGFKELIMMNAKE